MSISAVFEDQENMSMNITAKNIFFFPQSSILWIQMGKNGNESKSLGIFTRPEVIPLVCRNRQTPLQQVQR